MRRKEVHVKIYVLKIWTTGSFNQIPIKLTNLSSNTCTINFLEEKDYELER